MEGDFIKIRESLLPLSWIYGCGVSLRNFCFDVGLLKSHAFHVPVIAVGNITVGGTGKTPHVEHLIRLLQNRFKVAVLSRGYKRKTKGFQQADSSTTAKDIGDEPFQMKRKYPGITVAVDKKRVHGIQQLTDDDAQLDVVLLDDAFQHRYVKPGVNILLVDYHRLIIYDRLLPAGRLREPLSGKNRADIVVVTKCPKDLKPMAYRVITKAMDLFPYQQLYFTTLVYDALKPVFGTAEGVCELSELKRYHVLLLTGIASPEQMIHDLSPLTGKLTTLTYADHHAFGRKDVQRINEAFSQLQEPRCIITTEKDATRLTVAEGLSDDVQRHLYALPVRIRFMLDQEERFDQNIIGYVRKNSRNSILIKAKDDHKAKKTHNQPHSHKTIYFK